MEFKVGKSTYGYTPPPVWEQSVKRMAGMNMGEVGNLLIGKNFATQSMIRKELARTLGMIPGVNTVNAAKFMANNPIAKNALRAVPLIGAGIAVADVADVVAGQDSLANKAMDATAMGIGGTLGAIGGPLGVMAGASTGKAVSDFTQWLFGDKKTAEQRKMEQALAMLNRGVG
jgi:hypothetical protein